MKNKLTVIKIGGNIIDDAGKLDRFLQDFSAVDGYKILVHGGGKLATKLAGDLGVPQQMVNGRRITDAATLGIVAMVYAGGINKNIVARLQANGCKALGLCGADANIIKAHKRTDGTIDYGFVGDVDEVNTAFIESMLVQNIALVICPITHDGNGQLLNTNADTIAQETAKAMGRLYDVSLIYGFEKAGVLLDVNDDASAVRILNPVYYQELKTPDPTTGEAKIFAGMIQNWTMPLRPSITGWAR